MTDILKNAKLLKKQKNMKNLELDELLLELDEVHSKIMATRSVFNQLTDKDLIEACIYDMNALDAKYRHILRKIRVYDKNLA